VRALLHLGYQILLRVWWIHVDPFPSQRLFSDIPPGVLPTEHNPYFSRPSYPFSQVTPRLWLCQQCSQASRLSDSQLNAVNRKKYKKNTQKNVGTFS
jgi:hypothetical protein